jgi:hypothetical protein
LLQFLAGDAGEETFDTVWVRATTAQAPVPVMTTR